MSPSLAARRGVWVASPLPFLDCFFVLLALSFWCAFLLRRLFALLLGTPLINGCLRCIQGVPSARRAFGVKFVCGYPPPSTWAGPAAAGFAGVSACGACPWGAGLVALRFAHWSVQGWPGRPFITGSPGWLRRAAAGAASPAPLLRRHHHVLDFAGLNGVSTQLSTISCSHGLQPMQLCRHSRSPVATAYRPAPPLLALLCRRTSCWRSGRRPLFLNGSPLPGFRMSPGSG